MIYPPSQKPPIWSIDPGVIAYNCQRAGMPHPVLAMPMWEGAGDRVIDYSGNNFNLAVDSGNLGWNSRGIRIADTRLKYPDATEEKLKPVHVSVETLFTPDTENSGVYESLVTHRKSSSNPWNSFSINRNPGADTVEFSVSTGGFGTQTAILAANGLWEAGVPFHVIGTYDGAVMRLYVDGNEVSSSNKSGDITYTNDYGLLVGATSGISEAFSGTIHLIRINNVVLTAAQIKTLHNDPYFMYQIPEELYGYAAAAGISMPLLMQQMNQYDGGTYALC